MAVRNLVLLLVLLGGAVRAWSVEVSSIVSCKRDGEAWLCAAWKQGKVEVFRSETYLAGVEFDAPQARIAPAVAGSGGRAVEAREAQPTYTLQLLACRVPGCVAQSGLATVPGARVVEQRRGGTLWHLLVVGEYVTTKAAQKAAAELMLKYRLREKPWIRTLESLERDQVSP